jgi:hypothetical protein
MLQSSHTIRASKKSRSHTQVRNQRHNNWVCVACVKHMGAQGAMIKIEKYVKKKRRKIKPLC